MVLPEMDIFGPYIGRQTLTCHESDFVLRSSSKTITERAETNLNFPP